MSTIDSAPLSTMSGTAGHLTRAGRGLAFAASVPPIEPNRRPFGSTAAHLGEGARGPGSH
ncbi:hypothetical protein AB0H49_19335 [Nocardia sp. NPDC050713]|uniref:hypothetical protein n=1 Tax=Nocardia sp. NPDC050713 TaxID=3154511 RepID=UPI0033CF6537